MDQRSSGSVRCWQRRWRGRIVRSGGVTAVYSRKGIAWETLHISRRNGRYRIGREEVGEGGLAKTYET